MFLAPEVLDRVDHLSFTIKLNTQKHSRLLYLAVVDDMDLVARTITWVYLGPKRAKFCHTTNKTMATENASKRDSWVLQGTKEHRHTAEWGEGEMIVSWDRVGNERGWCFPKSQYADAITVLKAMEEQHDYHESSEEEDD